MARAESDLKSKAEASPCKIHAILGKRGASFKM